MTKVKICGITSLEDAELSVKFGADALGFNFYRKSPRYITPEAAAEIIAKLPSEVLKVGVFVNETPENIVKTAAVAGLGAIQLHGEETPEFLNELKAASGLEIIKAFRVSPDFKPEDVLKYNPDAILLDAYNPKEHGGTGETFDWEIAKKVQEIFPKMYLAGGLSRENVSYSIWSVEPYAIDACSGVEASKGVKDRTKLICFLACTRPLENSWPDMNFDDLLHQLLLRPQMYLGRKSLSDLNQFLTGFVFAIEMAKPDFDLMDFNSHTFHRWMEEKVDCGSAANPLLHILEQVGDEEAAFEHFFALWEEFRLETLSRRNS